MKINGVELKIGDKVHSKGRFGKILGFPNGKDISIQWNDGNVSMFWPMTDVGEDELIIDLDARHE